MTRIIGGTAGGRRLRTPPGAHTRPTADRVREALFSAIEAALGSLTGLAFLDLYAGSGAVGLEAVSRGAGAVTLVEQDRRTAGLIRANAAAVGLPGVDVVTSAVSRFLGGEPAPAPLAAYDVAFLDPPYDLRADAVVRDLRALTGRLRPGALVVVERSKRTSAVEWPPGYEPGRTRTYGETALWFGTWPGNGKRVGEGAVGYGHDLPDSPSVQEP
jgi:16S rRNA (guanine966-N2)-methyltransferase